MTKDHENALRVARLAALYADRAGPDFDLTRAKVQAYLDAMMQYGWKLTKQKAGASSDGHTPEEGHDIATIETSSELPAAASEEYVSALESALRAHHQWQCEANGILMFYVGPKTGKVEVVNISDEYRDSALCEQTVKAFALSGQ